MKLSSIFVSALFVFCSVTSFGQWAKGSSYVGARVGLSPLNNGFLVGIDYEYAITKAKEAGPGEVGAGMSVDFYTNTSGGQDETYIPISIYGTYHVGSMMEDKRFDPYVLFGMVARQVTAKTRLDTRSETQFDIAGALGMRYFFTRTWSGHLRLGFGASLLSAGVTLTL